MSTKWIMKCLVQTWIPRNSVDLNKSVCAHYKMEAVLPGPIDWRPTPTQTLTPKNMTCRHFIIISKRPIAAQQWQNQNPFNQNCRHIHLKQCTMIKSLSPCYMQIFFFIHIQVFRYKVSMVQKPSHCFYMRKLIWTRWRLYIKRVFRSYCTHPQRFVKVHVCICI